MTPRDELHQDRTKDPPDVTPEAPRQRAGGRALPADLLARVEAAVESDAARLEEIFKDIHAHPELGFMETRTAGIVAAELEGAGFRVTTGIGETGVVGVLENGEGPTVMFRADMDANAVEEATGRPYASSVRVINRDGRETPVAHLCGHDAHTTWLISLARTMSALADEWRGTLVLVAQPAEEPIEGAVAMVDDGLYSRHGTPEPDYFLALHTAPLPVGAVASTAGRLLTGSEHIDVTFRGLGGHGSSPHHARDPVVMAGMAIVQFQTIVSRGVDPEETAVLTIGSVSAGVDNNVIPTEAVLRLKLHFSTEEAQRRLVTGIERISDGIARSYGVPDDELPTIVHKGYASLVVNSPDLVERARAVLGATEFVTASVEGMRLPGSDDAFALIRGIEDVEATYLFLGVADPRLFEQARAKGQQFPFFAHEPHYRAALEAIPFGGKVAATLVLDLLRRP